MLFEISLTLLFLSSVTCSRVVDSASQTGIYVSDYCPKAAHCPEGTHVMCMYYNPNRVMGPRCRNSRNVSITPELANKLLDVTNAVRSKIARGEERGKDGQVLPRGYGIFRLKWDSELATFAQVLVNQCVLRHDQCRATKRFSSPGQTAGLVRFSVPDWIPKQDFGNFTKPGFTDAKLLYATAQILKSWYRQKSEVTAQILHNYPDWTLQPNKLIGKLYMEMIYGPATHMGCGVAAYTEYAFYDNNTPLYYNSIQIVCNFSARPLAGGAVFNTVPPGDTAVLNPCGCPAGSIEDEDCLCHEELKEPLQPLSLKQERTCPHGLQCDPTVVLLPIFSVEDAPLDKLVTEEKYPNASAPLDHVSRMDITDSLEILDNNLSEMKHSIHAKTKSPEDTLNTKAKVKQQWQVSHPKHNAMTVKNRHFGTNNELFHHEDLKQPEERNSRKQFNNHRSSIFSKTPRFELPGAHVYSSMGNKGNVIARKDFSGGKHLVDKYLYESIVKPIKRDKVIHSYKTIYNSNEPKSAEVVKYNFEPNLHTPAYKSLDHTKEVQFGDILPTRYGLDTVEERIISNNEDLENDINATQFFSVLRKPVVKSVTEVSDNKLMALLDTLEQEVKHIELREDEKQVFDAKIKKIYGKLVGKPADIELGFHEILNGRNSLKKIINNNNDPIIDETNNVELIQHIGHDKGDKQREKLYGDDRQEENMYNNEKREELFSLNHQNHPSKIYDEIEDYSPKPRRHEKKNFDRSILSTKNPLKIRKSQTNYDAGNKSYMRRNRNNLRQGNNNEINSLERSRTKHRKYDNAKDYSERKSQRRELLEKQSARNNIEKPKYRSKVNDRTNRNNNYLPALEFANEDPLSIDRRKYYQEKLDSIQRNLKNVRRLNHKKDTSNARHMRAMMPSSQRSVNQMDSLYGGRARFLHGY